MSTEARTLAGWELLRERNFGLFWLGQVVSGFGDRITVIALAALTWQLTQSAIYTTLAVVVTTVPHAFFGFVTGVIADALGPRRAMILSDLVRAVVIAAIPLVLFLSLPLAVVYLLVLVATFCGSLFNPARLALVPNLLPQRRLGAANSLVLVSDRTVEIAGSAVAGILVSLLGAAVFFVDAATFVFSAWMLQQIALAKAEEPRALTTENVLAEAVTGVRVIRASTVLFSNLLLSLSGQLSIAVVAALTPVFLFRDLHGGPEAFGAAEAAIAGGLVLAGLGMPSVMARYPKGRLVLTGFASLGVVLILLGASPQLPFAIAMFAAAGVANALFLIPNITIYQEHTPAEFRARVFATRFALVNLVWLPVMIVAGFLAEVAPAGLLIGIAGVFTLVTSAIGATVRIVRDVP